MDVGLDYRRVDTNLSPLFDTFLLCIAQQITKYDLPGLLRERFDICVERGFFESLIGKANTTKTPQTSGIINIKSQLFIGEIEKAHNDCSSQNLIGSHTARPLFGV
jgi:hypothetical protein